MRWSVVCRRCNSVLADGEWPRPADSEERRVVELHYRLAHDRKDVPYAKPKTTEAIRPERARDLFNYDPATGLLTWRVNRGRGIRSGDVCGTVKRHKGGLVYRSVTISGKKYLAHRLVWLLMTGAWPVKDVDHKNRNGCDNRWVNLREASLAENRWNCRTARTNKSGRKGVQYHRESGKFTARIVDTNGRLRYLGTFQSLDEAASAYDAAALRRSGSFARTNDMVLQDVGQ